MKYDYYDKKEFLLTTNYTPSGDQPEAILKLVDGLNSGLHKQTLLGVTGSGKTFTMANIIAKTNRPALILAPNKTLAAQLYGEMREFFPHNSVEYFVSYYDYYQPEAYIPSSDTFIEKDASINEHIEQMRLSATKAILERRDTVIVASVSSIYGLGDPELYMKMVLHLSKGSVIDISKICTRLAELQYERNEIELIRGTFRLRGDTIDIMPAESDELAVRINLFDNEIEAIKLFDPLTGRITANIPRVTIYPKTHYATPRETLLEAVENIKIELKERLKELEQNNKLLEAQRLKQRTEYDIEMILELGYCSGIENYSRFLSGRSAGSPPPTLQDYLPEDAILIIDESHATIPQLHGMYRGDRSRKETLVSYGFRLPSALDNRPLMFEEFEKFNFQTIYISATPSDYELAESGQIVEQVVRPTGLPDPIVEIRPAGSQVDDVLSEIHRCIEQKERVLITTLTKKMAEDLTSFLEEHSIPVRYIHSDINTVERMEIIRDLRLGEFDVLVGINLLREGLDIPEVSLVAIFDADKEGFLRGERALIQTIGRAARNANGKAILYADKITKSMQTAIDETARRREKQIAYNEKHGIIPKTVYKKITDVMEGAHIAVKAQKKHRDSEKNNLKDGENYSNTAKYKNGKEILLEIQNTEKEMHKLARDLEFEKAAILRDRVKILRQELLNFSDL